MFAGPPCWGHGRTFQLLTLQLQVHRGYFLDRDVAIISSVRSSNSHPDLLLIHPPTTHPLFQITPVLNTGLSLSEPLQLYKGYNAI